MRRWKASLAAPSAFAPTTTAQRMCAASPNLPFLAANAACASRPDAMRTRVARRRKSVRTQHADITRDPNLGPWAIPRYSRHAGNVGGAHALTTPRSLRPLWGPATAQLGAGPVDNRPCPSPRRAVPASAPGSRRRRPAKGVIAVRRGLRFMSTEFASLREGGLAPSNALLAMQRVEGFESLQPLRYAAARPLPSGAGRSRGPRIDDGCQRGRGASKACPPVRGQGAG